VFSDTKCAVEIYLVCSQTDRTIITNGRAYSTVVVCRFVICLLVKRGRKNLRVLANNSLYLRNGVTFQERIAPKSLEIIDVNVPGKIFFLKT